MPLKTQKLWLGSQESYQAAVEAVTKAEADPKFSAASDYTSEVTDYIMSVQDGVATINVAGSLIEGSAGYAVYYGVTGYDDIRNALAAAISNQAVSAILLNVKSGGGHVAGVHELGQLVARATKVKPIVTYTGSTMASAAVWSTIHSSYSYAAETAIVGSIGIIMVHMDRSKMLDEMGIKATTIRSGSEKALASPYEPLSEKAKEHLQAQADSMYDVFIGHVASARGVSITAADSKFGQGKEFVGKQAVQAGLIDAVGTYEDAFMKAMKLGASVKMAKKSTSSGPKAANSGNVQANADVNMPAMADNPAIQEGNTMPKPLTQAELEAMAAGVELTADSAAASGTPAAPETPAEGESESAADSSADTEATAQAKIELLQDMLAAANATAATATAAAKAATDELEASKDQLEKFSAIAKASLKTMGVHFGLQSDAIAAMDNATVLAEHSRVSVIFKDKFKVGGVAATTQDEVQKPKVAVSPMFAAVLKSTNAK